VGPRARHHQRGGYRLLRIVRRNSGSVVAWRRAEGAAVGSGQGCGDDRQVTFTSEDRVRDVPHNLNLDGFDSPYLRYAGWQGSASPGAPTRPPWWPASRVPASCMNAFTHPTGVTQGVPRQRCRPLERRWGPAVPNNVTGSAAWTWRVADARGARPHRLLRRPRPCGRQPASPDLHARGRRPRRPPQRDALLDPTRRARLVEGCRTSSTYGYSPLAGVHRSTTT
jgi:hypothetical protein